MRNILRNLRINLAEYPAKCESYDLNSKTCLARDCGGYCCFNCEVLAYGCPNACLLGVLCRSEGLAAAKRFFQLRDQSEIKNRRNNPRILKKYIQENF